MGKKNKIKWFIFGFFRRFIRQVCTDHRISQPSVPTKSVSRILRLFFSKKTVKWQLSLIVRTSTVHTITFTESSRTCVMCKNESNNNESRLFQPNDLNTEHDLCRVYDKERSKKKSNGIKSVVVVSKSQLSDDLQQQTTIHRHCCCCSSLLPLNYHYLWDNLFSFAIVSTKYSSNTHYRKVSYKRISMILPSGRSYINKW